MNANVRVAYLVTAYHEIGQLHRLCAALRQGDPDSLVHVQFDSGSDLDPPDDLAAGVRVQRTGQRVRWGDGSYMIAVLESMETLLSDDWDWLVLLSGQDYPVRPLHALHTELATSGFAAYAPVTGRSHTEAGTPPALTERYMFRYIWWQARCPKAIRIGLRSLTVPVRILSMGRIRAQPRPRGAGPGLGVRRQRTIFSPARPCWMGSDYVAVRRDIVEKTLELLRSEPEILIHYEKCAIPTESIFASVVRWIDEEHVSNMRLHYMNFRERANPRTLTELDLRTVWESGAFFARKFEDGSEWVSERFPLLERPS